MPLHTFTKMTIRKKLLMKMAKQMMYNAFLPMIRKPISNKELGQSGQTSLALRYKTLLKITYAAAKAEITKPRAKPAL